MRAEPIKFIKYHPLGFTLSALTGMIVGPWVLNTIADKTGITLGLPKVGAGFSVNGKDEVDE
jgi:hypothetical protein